MGATWSAPGVVLYPKDVVVSLFKFPTENVIKSIEKFFIHYSSLNRLTKDFIEEILRDADPDGFYLPKTKNSSLENTMNQIFSTFTNGNAEAITIDAYEFITFIIMISCGPLELKLKFLFKYLSGGYIPIENLFPDGEMPFEKSEPHPAAHELNRLTFYLLLISLSKAAYNVLCISPPPLIDLQRMANAITFIQPPPGTPTGFPVAHPCIIDLPVAPRIPNVIAGQPVGIAGANSQPAIGGASQAGEDNAPSLNGILASALTGPGGVKIPQAEVFGSGSNNVAPMGPLRHAVEIFENHEPKWTVEILMQMLESVAERCNSSSAVQNADGQGGKGDGPGARSGAANSGGNAGNADAELDILLMSMQTKTNKKGGNAANGAKGGDGLSEIDGEGSEIDPITLVPEPLREFVPGACRFVTCLTNFSLVDKIKSRAEGLMEKFRTLTHASLTKKKSDFVAQSNILHVLDADEDEMFALMEDHDNEGKNNGGKNLPYVPQNTIDEISNMMAAPQPNEDPLRVLQQISEMREKQAQQQQAPKAAAPVSKIIHNLDQEKTPPSLVSMLPTDNAPGTLSSESLNTLAAKFSSKEREEETIEQLLAPKDTYTVTLTYEEVEAFLKDVALPGLDARAMLDCQLRAMQKCAQEGIAFRTADFIRDPFLRPPILSAQEAVAFVLSQEQNAQDESNPFLAGLKNSLQFHRLSEDGGRMGFGGAWSEASLSNLNGVNNNNNMNGFSFQRRPSMSVASDAPINDQLGAPPDDDLLFMGGAMNALGGGPGDGPQGMTAEHHRRTFEWIDLRAYYSAYLAVSSVDTDDTGKVNLRHFGIIKYIATKLEKGQFSFIRDLRDVLPAGYHPRSSVPKDFLICEIASAAAAFRRKRQEKLVHALFVRHDIHSTGFLLVEQFMQVTKDVVASICQKFSPDVDLAARKMAGQLFVSFCLPATVPANQPINSGYVVDLVDALDGNMEPGHVPYQTIRSRLSALNKNKKNLMPLTHFKVAMLVLLRKAGLVRRMAKIQDR